MVGAVEARALKRDADRSENLAQTPLALGANSQRVIAEFLMNIEAVITRCARVTVGGQSSSKKTMRGALMLPATHQFGTPDTRVPNIAALARFIGTLFLCPAHLKRSSLPSQRS